MIKLNEIYQLDCLIGMQSIKEKTIDMILCDLPYGMTQNHWDSLIPLQDFIEIVICSKNKKLNKAVKIQNVAIFTKNNNSFRFGFVFASGI